MRLVTRNVNTAFEELVTGIASGRYRTTRRRSRMGEVLQVVGPVLMTYTDPGERVLSNAGRDANPFFHLYQSLWMLAGRSDVAALAYYNSKIGRYSDDGETFNSAYGRRWRDGDQLGKIVGLLERDLDSRRAVLQMWDRREDLEKAGSSLDVCCNTHVYFSVSGGRLDVTVCNRSNDLVLGLLGEDYLTFSMLHEYMAAKIGVSDGSYHHFTNNLHVYLDNWRPEEWLREYLQDDAGSGGRYGEDGHIAIPLVEDPARFDEEVVRFVEANKDPGGLGSTWGESFLGSVAQPACDAFHHYKEGRLATSLASVDSVAAGDWRAEVRRWLDKRDKKRRGLV